MSSKSLLLVLQLCLAVCACTARPITNNNENEPPAKSFEFSSSFKNEEKSSGTKIPHFYVASNPKVPDYIQGSHSTAGSSEKLSSGTKFIPHFYVASNPKVPDYVQGSHTAVKNDKVKDDIQSTSGADHDVHHEKLNQQEKNVDGKKSEAADNEADELLKGLERPWYDVDYAGPRPHPPHHN